MSILLRVFFLTLVFAAVETRADECEDAHLLVVDQVVNWDASFGQVATDFQLGTYSDLYGETRATYAHLFFLWTKDQRVAPLFSIPTPPDIVGKFYNLHKVKIFAESGELLYFLDLSNNCKDPGFGLDPGHQKALPIIPIQFVQPLKVRIQVWGSLG